MRGSPSVVVPQRQAAGYPAATNSRITASTAASGTLASSPPEVCGSKSSANIGRSAAISGLRTGADYHIDLHSGGSSLMYLPTAILGGARMSDEARRRKLELGRVFGAPYSFLFPSGQGGSATTAAAAARHGVISLGTEMGGTGTVTPECLRICEGGVRRILRHLGVWHGPVGPDEAPAVESRVLTAHSWDFFTYAPEDGVFEPKVELGDEVEAGQLAGLIHEPETPWRAPAEVHFDVAGVVICKRIPGRTERGDCLFHLGTDLEI